MKITKRQLRRIVKEEKALIEAYNSMSPRSKSLANAAKRQFAKDYPDVQVGIDGREGWITVDGKKAVNMSQASGQPLSIDDIIDQMKQAYLGHDMLSQEVPELTGGRKSSWQVRKEKELKGESVKITKRQLRRIIKEEKTRIIAEQRDDRAFLASMKTIMEQLELLPPASRIQSAETLIANLESVIDVANEEMSGGPRNEGTSPDNMPSSWKQILKGTLG